MVIRTIIILALIAAAICVPIVVLSHKSLMPSPAELAELDSLVKTTAAPSAAVERLASPDRIEKTGDIKTGYFMYAIVGPGGRKQVRADWRIEGKKVQLISVKTP